MMLQVLIRDAFKVLNSSHPVKYLLGDSTPGPHRSGCPKLERCSLTGYSLGSNWEEVSRPLLASGGSCRADARLSRPQLRRGWKDARKGFS
jgi:hypothetical protein